MIEFDSEDQFFQAFKAGFNRRLTERFPPNWSDEQIWALYVEWLEDAS